MKYISLEHTIRNMYSGQKAQTDDAQAVNEEKLDELVSAPVKNAGMDILKGLLKPKVPKTVPSIPKVEPAKPSVPSVKPAAPEPTAKPSVPSVKTAQPDATPEKKPEEKPTPKDSSKADAPPAAAVDQKVDDKAEDEKRRRRDFTMDGDGQISSTYKKARTAVNTTVGLAKKRTSKLYSEDLETKNRRLVSVVKKTVDEKKKKDKAGQNPLVDIHPTLKEPDQNRDAK
jgi:hypothetical protein